MAKPIIFKPILNVKEKRYQCKCGYNVTFGQECCSICETEFNWCNLEDSDPNGVDQHETGAKLDAGKVRMGLVLGDFANALEMVSLVGTVGANKYTDHGWLDVPDGISRYTDAMLRHNFKEHAGELLDPELTELAGKDVRHAACVAWNALARLELALREK